MRHRLARVETFIHARALRAPRTHRAHLERHGCHTPEDFETADATWTLFLVLLVACIVCAVLDYFGVLP